MLPVDFRRCATPSGKPNRKVETVNRKGETVRLFQQHLGAASTTDVLPVKGRMLNLLGLGLMPEMTPGDDAKTKHPAQYISEAA